MTLEEAIELVIEYHSDIKFRQGERLAEAIQLGIEALKRIKYRRDQGKSYEPRPLPGETEE